MELINNFEFTSKVDLVKRNVTDNILNKGELNDNFGHSDEIKVQKSGYEVISNLNSIIMGKKEVKDALESQIREMKSFITAPLTEPASDYNYRGYKEQITDMSDCLHLTYPYEYTCFRRDMEDNVAYRGSEDQQKFIVDKATAKQCEVYNELVYKCIDICAEICLATTMLNNLDPKGKYMLNVKQLKSLGF